MRWSCGDPSAGEMPEMANEREEIEEECGNGEWEKEGSRMIDMNEPEMLRRSEVEARLGVSRSWIYSEMRAGRFPEPVRIGTRAVRWRVADLDEWAAGRPASHGDKNDSEGGGGEEGGRPA